METRAILEKTTRRGRPGGLSPSQYNHAMLLNRVNNRRRMNIKAICQELHISRQHFYDILNGRVSATRDKIEVISERLGFTPAEILPAHTDAQPQEMK